MNAIAGFSIGFGEWPLLLLIIPAVAFLVYIYRRKDESQRVIVSSILILRHFKQQKLRPTKFLPPPRFFFEVLLFLLLCVAAANLLFHSSQTREAFVLDNSFSMLAREPSSSIEETYFKKSLEEVRRVLDLSSSRQVELFVTSPELHSLTKGTVSPSEAAEALGGITISFSQDKILPALQHLMNSPDFASVRVFTDRTVQSGSDRLHTEKIRSVSSLQNISMTSILLRAGESLSDDKFLEAGISSFAREPVELRVAALPYRMKDGQLAAMPALELSTRLDPLSSKTVTFDAVPAEAVAFRASLTLADPRDSVRLNSIREDDVAWLSRESGGKTIGVVAQESPQNLGLSRIPFLAPEYISPAQYPEAEPKLAEGAPVLFYKSAPETLPARDALFILPPTGKGLFNVQQRASNPQISLYDSANPLLSYVRVNILQLREAYPITALPWAPPVIDSTAGPLLIAGERRGHRYAVVGFEILPFEGRRSPGPSVLLLNTLKWLSNEGMTGNSRQTEASLDTDKPFLMGEYILTLPGYTGPSSLSPGNDILPVPGIVRCDLSDGTQRLVAVNFFSEEESNTLSISPITLKERAPARHQSEVQYSSLRRQFLFIILFLLLADMGFQLRKKVTAGAAKQ